MKHLILTLPALAGSLCLPAFAGDISSPSGFNVETAPAPGSLVGVLTDGTRLLSTGSFGADEISRQLPDGSASLWATGFGSLAGLAESPVTGQVVVGDSFGSSALWLLDDLNNDGDMLDAGEMVPHPAQPPVLSNGATPLPFGLAFAPGSDDLFMSGSTPFGVNPTLGVVTRTSGGAVTVYADDLGFAGGMVFDGNELYVGDLDSTFFVGRVWLLRDLNNDNDALDAGEANIYADNLAGASDLALASNGSLWVSGGTDSVTFAGCVSRLGPDLDNNGTSDQIEECLFGGFAFTGGLHLTEGSGFAQGAVGGGTLEVNDFGFAGSYLLHAAPLAETRVEGTVGPDSAVDIIVTGAPGSAGLFAISFDTVGITVKGVGNLCFGFTGLHALSPLQAIGPTGETSFKITFRDHPSLLGQPLVIQGVTVEDGAFGLGNALDFVFGS